MQSRLDHVALVAADPERSARIFEALLGAAVVLPGDDDRGPPEVSARLPGVTLVFVGGAAVAAASPAAHVALRVTAAELGTCRGRLRQLGLRFEEPRGSGKDRGLYFVDYDNNLFELCVAAPDVDVIFNATMGLA